MMEALWTLLSSLSALELGVGLAVTAAIITIVLDWRLALFSLLLQYLFLTLLLSTQLPLGLALVKVVAGAFACMSLYWTARRMEQELDRLEDGRAWFRSHREIYPMGLPFRFLALIFTAIVLFTLPEQLLVLPAIPHAFMVPAVWLLALGLLTIILTRDPLKTGMGLLAFQNGFELLYTRLEPGLAVLGLLGIGTILVGLVASYLAIARHVPLIEAREEQLRARDPHSPEALAEAVAALEKTPAPEEREEVLPAPIPQEEVPA